LQAAERLLGVRFQNAALLEEALTHASIADTRLNSNERLEFLGDAVLGMLACEHIFLEFPELLEGDMTKIKSTVVSRRTCATIANRLGLPELLKLGKGMQTRGDLPSSLAAAALESVIGAVYLEAGIDAVRNFIMPHLGPLVQRAADSGHQHNFKSVLQQHAQQEYGCSPAYLMHAEEGPDHSKRFLIGVQIDDRVFPACWGRSKKQAEQQAALSSLRELGVAIENGDGEVVIAGASMNGKTPLITDE
jgi:ribonuclease-3